MESTYISDNWMALQGYPSLSKAKMLPAGCQLTCLTLDMPIRELELLSRTSAVFYKWGHALIAGIRTGLRTMISLKVTVEWSRWDDLRFSCDEAVDKLEECCLRMWQRGSSMQFASLYDDQQRFVLLFLPIA